jgi:hypothetical protein
MWEPRRLTTLWVSTACYRDSFTLFNTVLLVYLFGICCADGYVMMPRQNEHYCMQIKYMVECRNAENKKQVFNEVRC